MYTNRPELHPLHPLHPPPSFPNDRFAFKAFWDEPDGSTTPAPARRSTGSLFEGKKEGLCSLPQQILQTDAICFLTSVVTADDNINLC